VAVDARQTRVPARASVEMETGARGPRHSLERDEEKRVRFSARIPRLMTLSRPDL